MPENDGCAMAFHNLKETQFIEYWLDSTPDTEISYFSCRFPKLNHRLRRIRPAAISRQPVRAMREDGSGVIVTEILNL